MPKKNTRRKRAEAAPSAAVPSAPPSKAAAVPVNAAPAWKQLWPLAVFVLLFFLLVCLTGASTIKPVAMIVLIGAAAAVFIRFPVIRERIDLLFIAVTFWVVLCGVSTFYAISGKFALKEFLKLAIAYGVFLIFLAFARKGENRGRCLAIILECAAALAGLFSIDFISTRFLSTPFFAFMGLFTPDFTDLTALEIGTRINSIFTNPNTFAGFVGIGVLLSLGLSNTARKRGERWFHLVCLYVSALSFVLAFSMGGSGAIVLAFLIFLLLEHKERRVSLLILMVETLVLVLAATFPIFLTSFTAWDGVRPIPLLCVIAGAALLCVLDSIAGRRVSEALSRHGKAVAALFLGVAAAVVVYAALALNVTGGTTLEPGVWLTRTAYPAPGAYTMTAEASGEVQVRVRSRNPAEVTMHTDTVLYNGLLSEASFTVPEDSQVLYFDFRTAEDGAVWLESAGCQGEAGSETLKLNYKLLPGFISNRLQGLFANANFVERFTFMADGLKLFRQSPVIGLGMGAFESALGSVQSYRYETKYVHNHYVQSLIETGVLGLILFLAVLVLALAAVVRTCRRADAGPLTAALGAAVVFMAGHGALELVFSNCYYLPMALGVLALIVLCCERSIPLPAPVAGQDARSWITLVVGVLPVVYAVFLGCNMYAQKLYTEVGSSSNQAADLQTSIKLDRFEWADPMLSYVYSARTVDDPAIRSQADQYAQRLAKVSSNTIPIYLAQYYFTTGQTYLGFEMVNKYVSYTIADPDSWQNAFHVLEAYYQDTPEFNTGVAGLYQELLDWNEANIGTLVLDEQSQAFIDQVIS